MSFALACLTLLFWPTFVSLVAIWWRSETFTHGFLIFPISGFLVWRLRRVVSGVSIQTDLRALPVLGALGFLWLLAELGKVLVIEQLAVIAMIPTLVWLLHGWPVLKTLAFPLGFLIFAVPMGEALIPELIDFTARFTVAALRLSGIPVYSEGTFFAIPTGNWSVVEGCSGLRYLVASVTLGTLYAYLSYRSFSRRLIFVALSIVVPILANGARAYLIVMIAHLSDMRLALGIDHFIYGWVFFGLVMLFLFFIGSFWREGEADLSAPDGGAAAVRGDIEQPSRLAAVFVSGLLFMAAWPAWALFINQTKEDEQRTIVLDEPISRGAWARNTTEFTDWQPRYLGTSAHGRWFYTNAYDPIGLYVAYYSPQEQSGELVNTQNVMVVQKHPEWRMPYQRTIDVSINGASYEFIEAELHSPQEKLLVWHWYWIDNRHMSSAYEAKLTETMAALFGRSRGNAGIVIYTLLDERLEDSRQTMRDFLQQMLPELEARLAVANASKVEIAETRD